MLKSTKLNINNIGSIIEHALKEVKENCITLMLSGGIDSIAASHFIVTNKKVIAKYLNISLESLHIQAFHFNHKLRAQNELMEKAARNFCDTFNIPIIVSTAQTLLKTESHARLARIQALSFAVKNSVVITAHHLNDCVESYIMNMLRGHEGYLPLPFYTKVDHNAITHPFIFTTKNEFIEYVNHHQLDRFVVEDETNKVVKGSRRNFIRNKIIPILSNENISLNKTVSNKMYKRLMDLKNG